MKQMSGNNQLGVIMGLLLIAVALITLLVTSIDDGAPIVSVYKDGVAQQVATPSNYYLPEGAIIHKDYGKGWKCVEFNGHFLLIRQAGSSSLAVKVDDCDIAKEE